MYRDEGIKQNAMAEDSRPMTKAVEVTQSPIAREYGRLTYNLQMVHDEVERLERRLSIVLIPVPESDQKRSPEAPREILSEFANSIRSDADQAHFAAERIANLIARLEIGE